MDSGLMVCRLLLAVPFAVAGLARLTHLARRRRGAGAWRSLTPPLAVAELAVAGGLASAVTAWPAAVLALCCLVAIAVPAAVRMARQGGTAGLREVVRADVLAVPAVVVAWEGYRDAGPGMVSWLAGLPVGRQVAVLGGVAVLAVLSSGGGFGAARRSRIAADPDDGAVGMVASVPATAALVRPAPELTIGMATYDDFDGVYFTLQALRLYHDLDRTELLVVDNYGCEQTREFVRNWAGGTYRLANEVAGTAVARDLVFHAASGAAVLCCDSHVLFAPGVIARLKGYHRDNPGCADLLQGPLVYDDGELLSTHFDPVWREQMWGVWATDPRGRDPDGEPFEIRMQGLGAFSCRTDAWLGFHPGFRGFGGEEGYIHEKFRRAGRRCLCLPWLRWMHRFGRPRGVPYPLSIEGKLRNYVLGHTELGLDLAPVLEHFSLYLPAARVAEVAAEAGLYLPERFLL
jgi:hypothetical protein